jgi:DNA-nicking Smr family endonuclease
MGKQRKKKTAKKGAPSPAETPERFNTPFANLAVMLKDARAGKKGQGAGIEVDSPRETPDACARRDPGPVVKEDERLFREAMAGVDRIERPAPRPRPPGPLAKPSRRPLTEEDLEAYTQLVDLVSGEGTFDIQYGDEYMEGAVVGVDPGLLRKLREGEFSHQTHLDLHGMTTDEARIAVDRFIMASMLRGLRCVLIIHGRGLNSRDQIPVLKQHLSSWLNRGRLKRLVLAFATARPCDGGAGALYVLLRKPSLRGAGWLIDQG